MNDTILPFPVERNSFSAAAAADAANVVTNNRTSHNGGMRDQIIQCEPGNSSIVGFDPSFIFDVPKSPFNYIDVKWNTIGKSFFSFFKKLV
jgi:hypothetical protein